MPSSQQFAGPVLVYAEPASLAQRLQFALAAYTPTMLPSWTAVETHAHGAACVVVGDPSPVVTGLPGRARRLCQGHAGTPLVIVTAPHVDHVRAFMSTGVSEIVWVYDTPDVLQRAVHGAMRRQPLDQLAARFRAATHLPLYLRNTLVHLCDTPEGIRTVQELCVGAGCHRSTLWTQWRSAVPAGGLRLQDVVDWVLLLRVCGRRAPGRSWSDVAVEAHVHEHTVARIARRVMGCSLRDLRHPLAAASVHAALLEALAPVLRAPHAVDRIASSS